MNRPITMSEIPKLLTPVHLRKLLLVFVAILVILFALAIIGAPTPHLDGGFGGAIVDLRADRAWVFLPGKCVTVSWNLEGIQSLYINGGGKIGWGEEKFCSSLEATSPIFEITAANGETRSYSLGVHYLPADVIHSLALMALLAPFVAAIYYLAFSAFGTADSVEYHTVAYGCHVVFALSDSSILPRVDSG